MFGENMKIKWTLQMIGHFKGHGRKSRNWGRLKSNESKEDLIILWIRMYKMSSKMKG